MTHRGELVTRDEIREDVWGDNVFVDFEHGLNLCIQEIRFALGDHALHPLYVETEPRRGYRFIAPVEEMSADAPRPAVEVHPSKDLPGIRRIEVRHSHRTGVYASVFAVLVAIFACWSLLVPSKERPAQTITLAVLPFVNLSGDPEQEYLVDGITDAVTADLAQIGGLRVISRTSAMQYKRSQKPLREIVRELNVDVVVEGSVIRSNDRVRITAQLIQASTETHLWAKSFEHDLQNILSLQKEVARTVAQEIRVELTPIEESRLVAARSIKPEVYEAYLKGRYFMHARAEEGLQKSIIHFQQAIQGDPEFAPAYAGLADAYALSGHYSLLAPMQAYPKAKEAAIKALEIDDSLAEAHTSLALVYLYHEWDFPRAQQAFQRAIELNASYSTAHHGYAMFLSAIGKTDQALSEIRRARELEPLSLIITAHEGWVHYLAGQEESAIAAYRRALYMDPNFSIAHWGLGVLQAYRAKSENAIEALEQAVSTSNGNPEMLASLAAGHAILGHEGPARKLLADLRNLSRERPVSSFDVALVHAGLGEKREAMKYLERAYDERAPQLVWIKGDPRFQSLLSEPRFASLLQRMRFPEPQGIR